MHNINAFVYYKGPGGASAEFGIVSYWVNVMKTADYVAQTAIGDAILVIIFLHSQLALATTDAYNRFIVCTSYTANPFR